METEVIRKCWVWTFIREVSGSLIPRQMLYFISLIGIFGYESVVWE